jgi:circadian clock protein KaiB
MPPKPARRAVEAVNEVTAFEEALQRTNDQEHYVLRLYVTGSTPRSTAAIANIRRLCEHYLKGHYDLEVIDIYQQPVLARGEQIIAAPTLIKKLPIPLRKMVGDLSNEEKVLMGLDIRSKNGTHDGGGI